MERQPHTNRKTQLVRQMQTCVATHCFCQNLDQGEQQETEREHTQDVDVLFDEYVVDDDLHIGRRRQREQLDECRQQQELRDCAAEACRSTPELPELQCLTWFRINERWCWCQLDR